MTYVMHYYFFNLNHYFEYLIFYIYFEINKLMVKYLNNSLLIIHFIELILNVLIILMNMIFLL